VIYITQNVDLRPYDADDLDTELWQFKILRDIGFELKEEQFEFVKNEIINVSKNESLKAAREKAKQIAWQYPMEAGKRVFEFMTDQNNMQGQR
jgi:DNA polymerase IIIc chi subunit